MMKPLRQYVVAAFLLGMCPLASAQDLGPVLPLSETHAMERVSASKRYLLLPVEENQENAHVRVMRGGQVLKEFNCRLAANKVDYYVPLDLKALGGRDLLLDITFTGRKRAFSEKDYACWRDMRLADTFDTTNRESFRPAYHHTPPYGWMNDPNGMFYKDGVWHLYFQYNPYGSQWENMTWGHSTSRDLLHWTYEGEAIQPDALGTVFSGSAVVDKDGTAGFGKDAVVAMFTSAGQNQTQSLAYSLDGGRTFTKYAGNPVITEDAPDFRDPKLFWYAPQQKWMVILAVGQHVEFYSSKNLRDWTFESSFGEGYGCHAGVWECPDMMELAVKDTGEKLWMIILNINPGGPQGGSATQYFVGHFDGHQFTSTSHETKWMDYGKDHYATVTFSGAPDGRHVALPWMSNWQYGNVVPTMQYRSANGLPRELGLFREGKETYVSVVPAREVMAGVGARARRLTGEDYLSVALRGSATLTLSNGKGEQVVMTYDAAARTFTMDRTRSGAVAFSHDFPAVTKAPTHGAISQLQVFIDHSSMEVFDAEGKMAMTNLVFPSEPYDKVTVKGKARVAIYKMNSK